MERTVFNLAAHTEAVGGHFERKKAPNGVEIDMPIWDAGCYERALELLRPWREKPDGRYYRYLRDTGTGEFVGEIAYHSEGGKTLADVIVYAPYRRRGYGSAGLALLCAAAKQNGVDVLYDDIAADNPSVALFLRGGFTVENRTDEIVLVKKIL